VDPGLPTAPQAWTLLVPKATKDAIATEREDKRMAVIFFCLVGGRERGGRIEFGGQG